MVVRTFARRHLVQVRCHHARSMSTMVPRRQAAPNGNVEAHLGDGSRTLFRPSRDFKSDFFSSKSSIPQEIAHKSASASAKLGERETWHPLVRQLRRELKGKNITRSVDRIWTLYLGIYDSQHTMPTIGSSSSPQTIPVLHTEDHQAVLRAITGSLRGRSLQNIDKKALVTNRYKGLYENISGAPDNVTEYLTKVSFIFKQLRQYHRDGLPSVSDYNIVLARLAPHGNMPALTALWAHLTGSTSEDFSVQSFRRMHLDGDGSPSLQPTADTYMHLMLGISRHLATQIQRIHKQNLTEGIWKGQGRKRIRKEDTSAKAAARGNTLYGQQVSPQARKAVQLAATRTISLLDDMLQRRITPDKMTVDLVLRIFRMDGHLDGITSILKLFGVDLKNPDVDLAAQEGYRRERLPMDVHTLNTILMAMGEQGTASEMIAAYETLSKPLPVKQESLGDAAMEGSLFALDWQSIFRKKIDDVEIESRSELAETNTKSVDALRESFAIMPNSTTITTMVKHCCVPPDPSRMVAGLNIGGSMQSIAKEQDHEARRKGEYISVASYLLSEAMDLQERQSADLARRLGFELPHIDALMQKVISWTAECEADLGEDSSTSTKRETFLSKLIEERKDMASLLSFDPGFIPHFEAATVSVNYEMIQPIIGHASRKRTGNFNTWRNIISQMQRAMAIKMAELQVLQSAIGMWDTVRRQGGFDESKMTNEGLRAFVNALRKQRRLVREEIDSMGSHFVDGVLKRFAALRQMRRERQYQPILKRRVSKQAEMETAMLLEEEKARADKVKLLEAEEAAMSQQKVALEMMKEDKIAVPAVEPAYK